MSDDLSSLLRANESAADHARHLMLIASYIAHAREDVPKLVAEVERLTRELAALPAKIAAKIEAAIPNDDSGTHYERGYTDALDRAAVIASSFIPSPAPPVEREWGVRHALAAGRGPWGYTDKAAAERAVAECGQDDCRLVSRVPGGEWEVAQCPRIRSSMADSIDLAAIKAKKREKREKR
jgi:hypothetical protein